MRKHYSYSTWPCTYSTVTLWPADSSLFSSYLYIIVTVYVSSYLLFACLISFFSCVSVSALSCKHALCSLFKYTELCSELKSWLWFQFCKDTPRLKKGCFSRVSLWSSYEQCLISYNWFDSSLISFCISSLFIRSLILISHIHLCFIAHWALPLTGSELSVQSVKRIKILIQHHNHWGWQCMNVEKEKKMVLVCRSTCLHLVVKETGFTGEGERERARERARERWNRVTML